MNSLSAKDLADLWDTRCCLEALAARVACQYITEQDSTYLSGLCDIRESAADEHYADLVQELDIRYHRHIIKMSRNRVLWRIFRRNRLLERTFEFGTEPSRFRDDDEIGPWGHRSIIDALARKKADLAETLMARHIAVAKQRAIEACGGPSRDPRFFCE